MAKSQVELEQEYSANTAQYKATKEKAEKDEKQRLEARKLAQRGIGLALQLRRTYEDMSKDNPSFKEKAEWCQKQVSRWEEELSKLGSSMSGIPSTTFDDIAGLEDVKVTIKNYLFALKNPEVAKRYNISTNVGMLMYGPPGTGKTLVAKAIAHELGVRFFVITPSTIFGSYVGESERNIRDIFSELRACEDGAVLLVDECESIFAKRTGDSNRAAIGVANQLLQEMNGANDGGGEKRIILGATNCPENIDEAYLRYKRFSLQFLIGMPNAEARRKVIDIGLKKLPYDEMVRDEMIRVLDETYTCADISGIIEQCAYKAMEEYRANYEMTNGKAAPVNIGVKHFREVMSTFSKSVTPEMVERYLKFRDERRNAGS